MSSPQRPLTASALDSNSRNSPSKMSSSPFNSSPFNSFSSSPFTTSQSLHQYWQGRENSPPKTSDNRSPRPAGTDGPPPLHSLKKSSIENLKRASYVRNSYFTQHTTEHDEEHASAGGSETSRFFAKGAWDNDSPTKPSRYRSNDDYDGVARPQTSPGETSASNNQDMSRVDSPPLSPEEPQITPPKSSLRRRTMPSRSDAFSSEDELSTPRRPKSVSFDNAPPQINEYERTTPDPTSSVSSDSRAGSDSEDDYDYFDDYHAQFHDEAPLEDTESTPVLHPGHRPPQHHEIYQDDEPDVREDDDDPFTVSVPEREREIREESRETIEDGEHSQENRPLPTPPVHRSDSKPDTNANDDDTEKTTPPAAAKVTLTHRIMSPQLRSNLHSNVESNEQPENAVSEDRLRWMRMRDSNEEARKQRERRMRRGGHNKDKANRRSLFEPKKSELSDSPSDPASSSPSLQSQSPLRDITNSKNGERPSSSPSGTANGHDIIDNNDHDTIKSPPRLPPQETTLREIRDEVTRHIPLPPSATATQRPESKPETISQPLPSRDIPMSPPDPSINDSGFDNVESEEDKIMHSSPPLGNDTPIQLGVNRDQELPHGREISAIEPESFQTSQIHADTDAQSRIPHPTQSGNLTRHDDYERKVSHPEEIRRKPVPEIVPSHDTLDPRGDGYDDAFDESDTGSVLRMSAQDESYAIGESHHNDQYPIESIEQDGDNMRHRYPGQQNVMETVEEDEHIDVGEEGYQRPLPSRPKSRMEQHQEERSATPDSVIHHASRHVSVSEPGSEDPGFQHEVYHDARADRIYEEDEEGLSNEEPEEENALRSRSRDTSYSRDSSPDIDAVPDVVATVKAPGAAFVIRPSLTPADVATMAATRRKVSGQGLPGGKRPSMGPLELSALDSEKETMPTDTKNQHGIEYEDDQESEATETKDHLIEEEEEGEEEEGQIEDDEEEFDKDRGLEEETDDQRQPRGSVRLPSSTFKLDVPVKEEDNGLFDVEQEFGRLFQANDNSHSLATADEILNADNETDANGSPERRQSGQVFMTPSGYLMRQNTKVVVASSRLSEDGNSGPPASRPSRRPSQQAWVTEPSKHRRSSLRSSGLSVTPSVRRRSSQGAGPPPSIGRESLGVTDLEPLEEEYADGEERGRLFVKVIGVRELDLPLPDDDRFQFALTLDNGMHCVTTSWLDLYRTSAIGQEFELMVFNDLEFQLTLQMKIDPPPPKPHSSHRSPSPSGNSTLRSQRMSTLSRVFASPKKRREQQQQQEIEARIQEEEQSRQANKYDTAAVLRDSFKRVRPLVAEDGSFARAYVSLSEFQDLAYGRPHIASIASFNEWATEPVAETQNDSTVASKSSKRAMKMMMGSTSSSKSNTTVTKISMRRCPPYQVGILDLQLLFVPKPKSATEEDMPSSMAVAIKEMKEADIQPPPPPVPTNSSANHVTWEGFLSHQPDDNPFRRRRCYFKLEDVHLRAYYETTRETRIINLANATKLIGTHEESSYQSGDHASFDEEEDFMFFEKGFQINFRSGEVINFYADNGEDKDNWVRALSQVVGKKINGQSHAPSAPSAPQPTIKKWTAMVLRHERANNVNRHSQPVHEGIPKDARPQEPSSGPGPSAPPVAAPSPMLSKENDQVQQPPAEWIPPSSAPNPQLQQQQQPPTPVQSPPPPSIRSPRPPSAAQRRLPQPPLKQDRPLPLPQSPSQRPLPSPIPGQSNGLKHRIPTSPPTAAARPLPQPRPQSRQYYGSIIAGAPSDRNPRYASDLRFHSHSQVQQHQQPRQPLRHPRPNIPSTLIPAANSPRQPSSPPMNQPPPQQGIAMDQVAMDQEMPMPHKAQTMRDHRSMPAVSAPQHRRTTTGPSPSSSSANPPAGSSNRHSQFFHSFKLPGMHKKAKPNSGQ